MSLYVFITKRFIFREIKSRAICMRESECPVNFIYHVNSSEICSLANFISTAVFVCRHAVRSKALSLSKKKLCKLNMWKKKRWNEKKNEKCNEIVTSDVPETKPSVSCCILVEIQQEAGVDPM